MSSKNEKETPNRTFKYSFDDNKEEILEMIRLKCRLGDIAVSKKKKGNGNFYKIMGLHKMYGNNWKMISYRLESKLTNQIKNVFFSAIRKCLRKSFKLVNKSNISRFVNSIKPFTLTAFLQTGFQYGQATDGRRM